MGVVAHVDDLTNRGLLWLFDTGGCRQRGGAGLVREGEGLDRVEQLLRRVERGAVSEARAAGVARVRTEGGGDAGRARACARVEGRQPADHVERVVGLWIGIRPRVGEPVL